MSPHSKTWHINSAACFVSGRDRFAAAPVVYCTCLTFSWRLFLDSIVWCHGVLSTYCTSLAWFFA